MVPEVIGLQVFEVSRQYEVLEQSEVPGVHERVTHTKDSFHARIHNLLHCPLRLW